MTKEVGQFEVTERGIEKIISEEGYGGAYTTQLCIPKETFIEAYQRYIDALEITIRSLKAWQKVRAEIASYKDDKLIHAERNEMIDIVLEIIDKYKAECEDKE